MDRRQLRRVQRARILESRRSPPREDDKSTDVVRQRTNPIEREQAAQPRVQVGPISAPAWVVITPGEKVWEVRCERCTAWWIAYSVTVTRSPALIQRLVDEHRSCAPRASSGPPASVATPASPVATPEAEP